MHKDSWIAEASKRFDFSESNGTESNGVEPSLVVNRASPSPGHQVYRSGTPSPANSRPTSAARSSSPAFFPPNEQKKNEPVRLSQIGTRGAMVNALKTGNNNHSPPGFTVSTQSTNQQSSSIQNSKNSFFEINTDKKGQNVERSPLSATVNKANTSTKQSYFENDDQKKARLLDEKAMKDEQMRESIMRSWKNGTPTPYHQVGIATTAVTSPKEKEGRDYRQASAYTSVLPPPPPPQAPSGGVPRSVSVPSGGSKSTLSRGASLKSGASDGEDVKSELMDAIRHFSVGSLRKVWIF